VVGAISSFAFIFFLGIFPSAIWSHLAYVVPPILILFVLLCDRLDDRLRRTTPALTRFWKAALVAAVAVSWFAAVRIAGDIQRWYPVASGLPKADLLVSQEQSTLYRQALRFISRCAGPDDSIFVAPDMPVLYFISQRPNPTPFDIMIARDANAELIVELLEARGTNCVVFNPDMYIQFESFGTIFPEVDRYLEDSFRRSVVMGRGSTKWHGLTRRQRVR
jgi:hypothetical protein